MSNKEPLKSIFLNLQLALWETPDADDNIRWEANIINAQTKEVLVKVFSASEKEAIGDAGYKLATEFFHSKNFEQVENSAIGSKKKNGD